jgi:PHD/YefM family antitoxin component YafN of YafNO toxin-antitoxin module
MKSYNQIFEKLVIQHDSVSGKRLIGMLAYAEYKLDKTEWTLQNPTSTDDQKDAFLSHVGSDRILDKYRNDAENTLIIYADGYAEKRLKEELEKLSREGVLKSLSETEEKLTIAIKATKVSYMKPVWQGIISSMIFTFGLFVLALIVRFASPNSSFGQLLQYFFAPENYELKVIPKQQ